MPHRCPVCDRTFIRPEGLGCHQTTQRHFTPPPLTAREAWTALLEATGPVIIDARRAVFNATLVRYDRTVMV